MVIKTGIDIVSIKRIENLYEKYGDRFLNRILTRKEQEYCSGNKGIINVARVAKRFSAKEAFAKCLGKGIGEISFLDIEILNDDCNAPYVNINDKIINYFKKEKKWYNVRVDVSLSDDGGVAIASVLVYADKVNCE